MMRTKTFIALVHPSSFDEDRGEVDLDSYYCISESDHDLEVALREIQPLEWIVVSFDTHLSLNQLSDLSDDIDNSVIPNAFDVTNLWRE